MGNWIIDFKTVIVLLFLAGLLSLPQFLAHRDIIEASVVWTETCSLAGWEKEKNGHRARVACGDGKSGLAAKIDPYVVSGAGEKEGIFFVCKKYRNGSLKCGKTADSID